MKTKVIIRFSSEAYRYAGGRAPYGYGRWAFGLKPNADSENAFFATGTLAQARAKAKAHFTSALSMVHPNVTTHATVYVLS